MLEPLTDITPAHLREVARQMSFDGYRFITATCVDNGDNTFDLFYHFDKDLQMQHFRLHIAKDEVVPSISRIYFCALLVENEISELFGVRITDIVIDYGGHLLLSDGVPDAPQACGGQITIVQKDA